MEKTQLSKYRVVTETPEDLLKVPCILGGKIGEEVYQDILRQYGEEAVGNITPNSGSTPFYVSAVNDRILEMTDGKARVATHADLERLRKLGQKATGVKIRGNWFDSGLVLYDVGNPNKDLADKLGAQAKNLGLNVTDAPIVFWNKDFTQPGFDKYDLREGAQPFHAEILAGNSGDFASEDIDEATGLTTKLTRGGDRYLWTPSEKSGVRRLYLYSDRGVNADIVVLRISVSYGRVALVGNAEGIAPENLEQ